MPRKATKTKERSNLIWERAEPVKRPTPAPLSRDQIVRTAIAIADSQGLEAVSLRKVGAALGAGPMRLYGYMTTKSDLLDLMVDVVYGEMVPASSPAGNWRDVIRAIAYDTRQAAQKHEWFVDLLGGRPHQGPNALLHLEASLAAFANDPGFGDIDLVLQAVKTVNAYVIGTIQSELREVRAERESGLNKTEWQEATGPYLFRMIETGRFATIARVVQEANHPSPDIAFEQGLNYVLDGIAAQLAG
jgi:AcrR family transcriptional regulator